MSVVRSPEEGSGGSPGGPIANVQPMSPDEAAAFEARRRKLLKYVLESKLAGRESEFPAPEEAEGVDVAASMSRLRARMAEGPAGAQAVRNAFAFALDDIQGHDRYGPVRDAILRELAAGQPTPAAGGATSASPQAKESPENAIRRSADKLRLLDHAAEVVRKRRDMKHKIASGTDLTRLEADAADYAGSFKNRVAAMRNEKSNKAALEAAVRQSVTEGALQVKDYEDAAAVPADLAASLHDAVEADLAKRQVAAESMERIRNALLLRKANEPALMSAKSVADELLAELNTLSDDLTGEGRPGQVAVAAAPGEKRPESGSVMPHEPLAKPAGDDKISPSPLKRKNPQSQAPSKDSGGEPAAKPGWMDDEPAVPESMRQGPHRRAEPQPEKPKSLFSRLTSALGPKPLPKPAEPESPIRGMDYDALAAHFTPSHMRAFERELDEFESQTRKQLQADLRRRMTAAKMLDELRKAYPGSPNVRH